MIGKLDQKELELSKLSEELNYLMVESLKTDSVVIDMNTKINEPERISRRDLESASKINSLEILNQKLQIQIDNEKSLVLSLKNEIEQLKNTDKDILDKSSNIIFLENKLAESSSQISSLQVIIQEMRNHADKEQYKISMLDNEIERLQIINKNINMNEETIINLKETLNVKENTLQSLVQETEKMKQFKDTEINRLRETLKLENDKLQLMREKVERENQIKCELEGEITHYKNIAESNHKKLAHHIMSENKIEKVSIEVQTLDVQFDDISGSVKEIEDLKFQLKVSKTELVHLYERVTQQEIDNRELKLLEPRIKELESDLEALTIKHTMLEQTAQQTNLLNDDLNEKYLETIKKSKNLEILVKKLHRQVEEKRNLNQNTENMHSPELSSKILSKRMENDAHEKASPRLRNKVLKRATTESEKSAESESRTTNPKQKLGPASRVPALESRKIRKIDSSRENRQECNQQ